MLNQIMTRLGVVKSSLPIEDDQARIADVYQLAMVMADSSHIEESGRCKSGQKERKEKSENEKVDGCRAKMFMTLYQKALNMGDSVPMAEKSDYACREGIQSHIQEAQYRGA